MYGPASAATRANPLYNNIALQDIGDNSAYNALIVNYQRRIAHGLLINASYTWSHSIDDAPEANSYDQGSVFISDPTNRNRDRGNAAINRPDAFTLSTVWAPVAKFDNRVSQYLANNNQFSILANVSSGDEQNITANSVLNGDSLAGSGSGAATRPLFVARNTARTPSVYQFDIRYTRTLFKLRDASSQSSSSRRITFSTTRISPRSTPPRQWPRLRAQLSPTQRWRLYRRFSKAVLCNWE